MDKPVIINLIVLAVFGALCSAVATSRGRSGVAWFCIGFLFNCFGLIVLLVIPDLTVEQEQRTGVLRENRRLRERLAKDRTISDRRYAETHRRLQVHDRAIGIDTTAPLDELVTEGPPPLPGEQAIWFYLERTDQQGPVPISMLRRLWDERVIGPKTFVWRDGMVDWREVRDIPDLGEQLGA